MMKAIEFTYDELQAVETAVLLELKQSKERRQRVAARAADTPHEKLDKLVSFYDKDIRDLESALEKLKARWRG